tara:strand:+ start:6188 stop:6532 length:345 start_codon:yes stop_codon:yes gene_type:complete
MSARRITWGEISPHVKSAMCGDDSYFEKAIESGQCQAWKFSNSDLWMITRSEGEELVVCCLEGSGLKDAAPQIIRAAAVGGFEKIRFHTKRPGLGKMLSGFGFEEFERIYKLEL